ncbi:MAG: TDP-N-acetylfucosamine:lipid II N-acetylfucosaminyltransferase [Flavobacteriales bacterium]|nr:TDP-N-acetylfucosamine:lipid II N-acetylfucosaminyltransferase [Flavobacteriales bacterium]
MDYFAHFIEEDFDFIQSIFGMNAKFIPFQYGGLASYLESPDRENHLFDKNNLLVGNSADPSNNHIELIDELKKIGLSDCKMYALMAYAGGNDYVEKIREYGRTNLGDQFNVISDFVPLNEHYKLIETCAIVLFGHLRSQGTGNLIPCMANGSKAYMYKSSSLYQFFIQKRIEVYSIEDDFSLEHIAIPLSQEEKTNNLDTLRKWFGSRTISTSYENLLNLSSFPLENNVE